LIHASYYRPRVYPFGSGLPAEMDRFQDLSGGLTLNREKIKEIGRDGIVDWRKRIPTLRITGRQYEYGSLEFWLKLGNKGSATDTIDLNDFKNSMVDICCYKTDDDGTFQGTVWYPKLRLAGFSLAIGDPQAYIERNFEWVGEDEIQLLNDNKYFIHREFTADGGTNETFVVSDAGTTYPDPISDPDNSGYYLFKVVRVRAGIATELVYTTDYTYDSGTVTLTVVSTTNGDKIKVYWSAGSYITGEEPFTNNDSDAAAISASSCSIYLQSANYVYKLQSVNIDVSFDRTDYYEIGNKEVIQRGIRNKTCTVTLGRILEDFTIEEIARGVTDLDYGKIDAREFLDNLALIVKIYDNDDKDNFLMKYTLTDLSPVGLDAGIPVDDYVSRGATLECEACTITTAE